MNIIKSVQRGVGTTSSTSIAINEVDPDKCIVLINGVITTSASYYGNTGSVYAGYYGNSKGGAIVESLTATSLNMSNIQNDFSWQVVEFA